MLLKGQGEGVSLILSAMNTTAEVSGGVSADTFLQKACCVDSMGKLAWTHGMGLDVKGQRFQSRPSKNTVSPHVASRALAGQWLSKSHCKHRPRQRGCCRLWQHTWHIGWGLDDEPQLCSERRLIPGSQSRNQSVSDPSALVPVAPKY